jgi:glutaminyl-peptide cyclotransferase
MRRWACLSYGLMRRPGTALPAMGIVCALAWLCTAACSHAQTDEPVKPVVRQYQYQVVASYPHDRRAFTQGLVYENGLLYEGTGLYGQSTLAKRDLKTGKALKTIHLARGDFGEGIAIVPDTQQRWGGDRIVQLTWRNKKGYVYKKDTFTLLKEFTYRTEGWGITCDGSRLIYSDGTATLRFLDPNTLAMTGRIEVRDQGRPVRDLNELEYIEGSVFANVWTTNEIVVLDPKTGQVTGRLDLSALYPRPADSEDVLNGIAWIPETKHLLVTGKLWPKIYEIELISGSTDGSQQ